MHVGKNIETVMIVLFPSVNTLHFQSQEIPTFSFYIDWFIVNYKDQTDNKLPESGLCAHITLKTDVLRGRNGKGTTVEEFVLRQK